VYDMKKIFDVLKLLVVKQKLMHRYRCTNCGNIHSKYRW